VRVWSAESQPRTKFAAPKVLCKRQGKTRDERRCLQEEKLLLELSSTCCESLRADAMRWYLQMKCLRMCACKCCREEKDFQLGGGGTPLIYHEEKLKNTHPKDCQSESKGF
jgi:hypothetical protein